MSDNESERGAGVASDDADLLEVRLLGYLPTSRPDNDCWEWQGPVNRDGYGQFMVATKRRSAHRTSYEYFIGPIPTGLAILHSCDNPPCVNPNHLRAGTIAENNADMLARGRAAHQSRTQCVNGHEYTPENIRLHKGRRVCRTCVAANSRRHRLRKLAAGPDPQSEVVRVGQVWADNDYRMAGREVIVLAVDETHAVVQSSYRGRKTRVKLDRFRPTSTGFRLTRDAVAGEAVTR